VSDRSYSVGGCLGGLGLETQKRMITNIIGLRRSLYCVDGCGVQTEVFQELDIRARYLLIYKGLMTDVALTLDNLADLVFDNNRLTFLDSEPALADEYSVLELLVALITGLYLLEPAER
jgi:hypothetical protein